jgi:hypothetical protein
MDVIDIEKIDANNSGDLGLMDALQYSMNMQ